MLSKVDKKNPAAVYQNGHNLRGKTVVIIGDSAGVGLATAVMLAERGAPVFLAARNIIELKQAVTAINQAGGEGDGMVADVSRVEECRRFFLLAEGWLGRIDAVISPLTFDTHYDDIKGANIKSSGRLAALAGQNLCMQEAIQRMQARGQGHIINVNLAGYKRTGNSPEQREAANLRRLAGEQGIRVTVIEPGVVLRRTSAATEAAAQDVLSAQDIARCIIDSLSQPFGVDMVVLPGTLQVQQPTTYTAS